MPAFEGFLACGGRELVHVLDNEIRTRTTLPDRIVHVSIVEMTFMVVLAHGQVFILDPELQTLSRHCLEEDFLLYSATVISARSEILIAMGTVFHGIEIYQVDKDNSTLQKRCSIQGHEGSIFGLCSASDGKALFSVSDDRTLRKWSLPIILPETITKAEWIAVGHRSRVWRVLCMDTKIVTAAEDFTVRVWDEMTGDCMRLFNGHIGMNIWALATRGDVIASGGDDGSVRLWKSIKEPVPQLMAYSKSVEPKCFSILPLGSLVTLLADGTVEGLDCFIPPDDIKRNAVLKTIDSLLLIGNLSGMLIIQNGNSVFSVDCKFASRIVYIEAWMLTHCIILVQAGDGKVSIIRFNTTNNEYQVIPLSIESTVIKSSIIVDENCLLLGSRDGRVLHIGIDSNEIKDLGRISTEAITCIQSTVDTKLLMTDRNGQLSSYKRVGDQLELEWCHKLTKSWLEKVFILPDGRVMIAGFEGTSFFLYNFTTKQEIVRLTTGGAHRFWSLSLVDDECIFAFIRLGKVYKFHTFLKEIPSRIIKEPLHGAEIRASAHIDDETIITGGEDGRLVVMDSKLRILDTIIAHSSGIKCLAVAHNLVYVGGSGEELTCWRWSDSHLCKIAAAPLASRVREARVMDVVVSGNRVVAAYSDSFLRAWMFDNENFVYLAELEAHPGHCCLKVVTKTVGDEIICYSGGTDGLLVKSSLSVKTLERTNSKVQQSETTAITIDETQELTCGDDEMLAKSSLYMTKLEGRGSLKVHQSGINAIAIDETRILTGGDDGMLAILDHNLHLQHTNAQAHHSTITAVALTPSITSLSTDQRYSHWTDTLTLLHQKLVQQPDPSTMYAGNIY
ncbi:hypothetical protein PSACC_00598 [Paramicrosporidium saccamoebae]|uniref:WD40 repeat-like protein n=1 Tax=Paramicrosporidium saccamoebae TaxID=1246581 RepID=A0A2H9TPD7_9FUNG|nr:hypothetical protein PSACC_00598 [Paramicrosporidium saccamoebae]